MTGVQFRNRLSSMRKAVEIAPARSNGWRLGLFIAMCLLLANVTAGQEYATVNPYKVEAAFLRNFAHYVNWPESAFADTTSPWRVCILGQDPFGEVLKATLKNRTEQGRPFEVYTAESLEELPGCHIVFIAFTNAARRRAALVALQGQPVLTVGEAPEFLQEGGVIQFQISDHVEIGVNLDQARAVSLKIQTQVLEVTRMVVENGIVRRLR